MFLGVLCIFSMSLSRRLTTFSPSVRADVTEHQGHSRTCPCWQKQTTAVVLAAIRARMLCPTLVAVIAYLVGLCWLSEQRLDDFLDAALFLHFEGFVLFNSYG